MKQNLNEIRHTVVTKQIELLTVTRENLKSRVFPNILILKTFSYAKL